MEQMTELLGKLAEKIGTTVGQLWGALIKQAPISGAVDLMLCIGLVIFSVWSFRFVKGKTTKISMPKGGYEEAEWEEELAFAGWVGVAFVFLVMFLVVGSLAEMILAAFFNPEYWALSRLLDNMQ